MSFLDTQERAKELGMTIKTELLSSNNSLSLPLTAEISSKYAIQNILNRFSQGKVLHPVGVQGLSDLSKEDSIGSYRQTVFDLPLAQYLTTRLWEQTSLNLVPVLLDEFSPVDWQSQNPDKLNYWIPLHVSPVFRYMEYGEGGSHNIHYDSPHIDKENPLIRTLQSGVLYLTDNEVYTRFIEDGQSNIPFTERNLEDWEESLSDTTLINSAVRSKAGRVLVFPHQLAHDVSKHTGVDKRIIIRFDIFYQAVGKV